MHLDDPVADHRVRQHLPNSALPILCLRADWVNSTHIQTLLFNNIYASSTVPGPTGTDCFERDAGQSQCSWTQFSVAKWAVVWH